MCSTQQCSALLCSASTLQSSTFTQEESVHCRLAVALMPWSPTAAAYCFYSRCEYHGTLIGKGAGGKGKAHKQVALPLVFDQAKVKDYLPDGATCWRGNVRGEWWGHQPPFSRVVKKLDDYDGGERDAIIAMLQRIWKQHCWIHNTTIDTCWIKNLFEKEVDKECLWK